MASRYDDRDYDRENYGRRSDSDYGRSWGGRSQGRYRYGDNERSREMYGRESGSSGDYGNSRSEYGGGRSEYGSGRGEYRGGGRGEYRGGGGYQSSSRREYEGGRQSYGGSGRGGWEPERDDAEDRDERYGRYRGGYGQGYNQSSSDYRRDSQYNYPTGFRSSREYDERGRSDYGRSGNYGLGYGGASSGRGYDYERDRSGGEERGWWDRASDAVASWFGDEEAERRRRMDQQREHRRGRGPKGYRRSDERIKEDINDRMTDDYYLDASEIEIEVSNGEVTLTGTVFAREDKRRAEDIAESVSGVSNVENRIRVKQRYGGAYEDLPSSTMGTSSAAARGGTGTGSTGTGTSSTGTSGTGTSAAGSSGGRMSGVGTSGTSGTGTSGSGTSETGTSVTSKSGRSSSDTGTGRSRAANT